MDHQFQLPGSYKKWTYGLIGVGLIALLYGIFFLHPFTAVSHGGGNDAHASVGGTRFWAVLLQNSVFFLLVVNAAMFFICVTTMAMAGWVVAFRRVSELPAIIMEHVLQSYHLGDRFLSWYIRVVLYLLLPVCKILPGYCCGRDQSNFKNKRRKL